MDALLEQVQTLALQADDATRHKVLSALRSLQLRLETPHDTLSRYSGLVRIVSRAIILRLFNPDIS